MRAKLAALLLLAASALPLAARADTFDVMTVSGNGHTWVFDFPTVENFTYPTNLVLFVPGFTPLSETIDGASVTPTEIFIHPDQNISGPFGQLMIHNNPLNFLSVSGPFTDPSTLQSYLAYTATFVTGSFTGTEYVYNGNNNLTFTTFDIDIEQQSVAATPEPPALPLLATAGIAIAAFRRRIAHA